MGVKINSLLLPLLVPLQNRKGYPISLDVAAQTSLGPNQTRFLISKTVRTVF